MATRTNARVASRTKKRAVTRGAARSGARRRAPKRKPAMTQSELFSTLAERAAEELNVDIKPREVKTILSILAELAEDELKSKEVFKIPGVVRMVTKHKPAQPRRKGINPFTKEPTVFKAKPARTVVRAGVVKTLKDAVA